MHQWSTPLQRSHPQGIDGCTPPPPPPRQGGHSVAEGRRQGAAGGGDTHRSEAGDSAWTTEKVRHFTGQSR